MAKGITTFSFAALMSSFVLFNLYSWSNYLFLGLSILIFTISILNSRCINVEYNAFFALNVAFILYTLCSSLWALQPSDSLIMARTLSRTFICAYVVYIALRNMKVLDITDILKSIMWAGYFVALYSIIYYGYDTLLAAGKATSLRLDSEFSNVNTIGMACALSCVIQISLMTMKKKFFYPLDMALFVLTLIVITATQSRKALFFLIAGALGSLIVGPLTNETTRFKKIVKIILCLSIFAFATHLILQMDIFSGITKRVSYFINSLTRTGEVDDSSMIRASMRKQGLNCFWQYPIGGIGIANAHIWAAKTIGIDTYLHDNFVELLCGGGIIGFCLYYAMYVYLFSQLWKYRKVDKQRVAFFALWLGLMLAMNFGMVTYYSKAQNFYLMIHFVNVFDLKRKASELCKSGNTSKQ